VLYIEREDFMETPPKKFFRLSPGAEVRLRYSYILKCERAIKDESGAVIELRCTFDADSLNGPTAMRKVKGTIHWVSATHACDAEVRLYDRLFLSEDPGAGGRTPR
jgi:glutaminyl-tRNA synthetase